MSKFCLEFLCFVPELSMPSNTFTVLYLCCEGGSWQWVGRGTGSWARGLQSAQRLGEKLESIR